MIVVDTSVWVEAFRSGDGEAASALKSLLDEDLVLLPVVVKLELLSGASSKDHDILRRLLSALPVLYPAESTWARIESWIDRAREGGRRFGITDLLIGAMSAEAGASMWSLDGDFSDMAELGFLDLPS